MKITEFIENYKAKKFMLTNKGAEEMIEYLKKELAIKEYLPFVDFDMPLLAEG